MSKVKTAFEEFQNKHGENYLEEKFVEYLTSKGIDVSSIDNHELGRIIAKNFKEIKEYCMPDLDVNFNTLNKEELLDIVDLIPILPYNRLNFQSLEVKLKIAISHDEIYPINFSELEINILVRKILNNDISLNVADIKQLSYTIPDIAYRICKHRPNYIINIPVSLINEELLDLVFSNKILSVYIAQDHFANMNISTPLIDKYLVKNDGNYLGLMKHSADITDELIELALNNEDPSKRFNIDDLSSCPVLLSSKIAMKRFLKMDGKLLRYVPSNTIDQELIQIAISNPDKDKRFDIFDIEYCDNIKSSPEAALYFCRLYGPFLRHFIGHVDITVEIAEAALNHENPEENYYFNDLSTNKKFITNADVARVFLEKDGNALLYISTYDFQITDELLDIAMNHEDSSKNFKLSRVSELDHLLENPSVMLRLCKIDGNYLKYSNVPNIPEEIIVTAMSHEDPNLNFNLRYLSANRSLITSLTAMKYFCKINGNCLFQANVVVDEELARIALSHDDIYLSRLRDCPVTKDYESVKNICKVNGYAIEYIPESHITTELVEIVIQQEEIKKDAEFQDRLFKLAGGLIHGTTLYEEMLNRFCIKHNIDIDFVRNVIDSTININDEIIRTMNPKFLKPEYLDLCGGDMLKYVTLCTYPDVQDEILNIINNNFSLAVYGDIFPKYFDYFDFQEKLNLEGKNPGDIIKEFRLNLLKNILKHAITNQDGSEKSDWIPYYAKIISSYNNNPAMFDMNIIYDMDIMQKYFSSEENFDDLLKIADGIVLTDNDIKTMALYLIGKHKYNILKVQDLRKYDEIRNTYIEDIIDNSDDINLVKDAILEKVYGISIETAKELYIPFNSVVKESPELFDDNVIIFFRQLERILESNSIDELKMMAYTSSKHLTIEDVINMRHTIKKTIIENFNNSLYKLNAEDEITEGIEGVKVYLAAGKNVDKQFNISISALGAYSGFNPYVEGFNYKEDWNRPKIASHGICTSLIGNNNLGTARIKASVLGFTDYEDGSLLLCGPYDIASAGANFIFDTSKGEIGEAVRKNSQYLSVKGMMDHTRHTHNEVVFERRLGDNTKRQPAYIVLFCDDYEELITYYKSGEYDDEVEHLIQTIKTAKDFNLPIVVVEREKIAIHERKKIDESLSQFTNMTEDQIEEEKVRKLYYEIITQFENNHAGNREYHEIIDDTYFSKEDFKKIIDEILNKIESVKSPEKKRILIELLAEVAKKEHEKFYTTKYSGIITNCQNMLESLQNNLEERVEPLYVSKLLDDKIIETDYVSEYSRLSFKRQTQFSQADIQKIFEGGLKEKINNIISDMYTNNVYGNDNKAHSTKHVEDVIAFAGIIGKDIGLNDHDINLLLKAAEYHDSGRTSDFDDHDHGNRGAEVALNNLYGNFSKEDLAIIAIAIEYHEIRDNAYEFIKLIEKYGLDPNDKDLVNRINAIASCLKDADALDRTRFLAESKAFIDEDSLRTEIAPSLIKIAEQLNEGYAVDDLSQLLVDHPEYKNVILDLLEKGYDPKKIMHAYRKEYLNDLFIKEDMEIESGRQI